MATKKKRAARELPLERFVTTEEESGILAEHPVTSFNKSNPDHPDYDAEHPKPIRGPAGAPCRWWLPDIYRYAEKLKQRSEGRAPRKVKAGVRQALPRGKREAALR